MSGDKGGGGMTLTEIVEGELGKHVPSVAWEMPAKYCGGCGQVVPCPAHRHLSALRVTVKAMTEAAEAKGAFSRDPLTHAENIIRSMVSILVEALAAARKELEP